MPLNSRSLSGKAVASVVSASGDRVMIPGHAPRKRDLPTRQFAVPGNVDLAKVLKEKGQDDQEFLDAATEAGKMAKTVEVRTETTPGTAQHLTQDCSTREPGSDGAPVVGGLSLAKKSWKAVVSKKTTLIKQKVLKTSWTEKERQREHLRVVREKERALKEAKAEGERAKRERQREAKERREANEKKSEITQVIRDPKKIKKMSKKQLRYIRKAGVV